MSPGLRLPNRPGPARRACQTAPSHIVQHGDRGDGGGRGGGASWEDPFSGGGTHARTPARLTRSTPDQAGVRGSTPEHAGARRAHRERGGPCVGGPVAGSETARATPLPYQTGYKPYTGRVGPLPPPRPHGSVELTESRRNGKAVGGPTVAPPSWPTRLTQTTGRTYPAG